MSRPRPVIDFPWPRPALRLTQEESEIDAALRVYQKAVRFRRACGAALRPFGISFPPWWVLFTTDRLIREADLEVSQRDVGRRMGLGQSTISQAMRKLRDRHWIEREPDEWMADCILLTDAGESLLAAARCSVSCAARQLLSEKGVAAERAAQGSVPQARLVP